MSNLLAEFFQSSSAETLFLDHLLQTIDAVRGSDKSQSILEIDSGRAIFNPLLLGYNGAANTGADVRVIEMLRQFKVIFGHLDFKPALMTSGSHFDHSAFDAVDKLSVASYFPDFLSEQAQIHTGAIACEGSMFTSTFSDSLTGMFAGGLGYAAANGQLSVGYGAEASSMTPSLDRFVRSACKDSLVIARTSKSFDVLKNLNIRSELGADTAWTFEPAQNLAQCPLRKSGWDGHAPVAVLCPINPFCWPVVIDMDRAKAPRRPGEKLEHQYNDISFHSWSAESARKYDAYLAGFSTLIRWLQDRGYFPVLVGMQDLDKPSCDKLNESLASPIPLFVRGGSDIDEIVSLLHRSNIIVSSRFHATVLGMSGGTTCIGVSMDSRINSLFSENGLAEWVLPCDAEFLGECLIDRVSKAEKMTEPLQEQYARLTAQQIRIFGQMGIHLMDEATKIYVNFPPSPLTRTWDAHLPPLSARIENILSRYA